VFNLLNYEDIIMAQQNEGKGNFANNPKAASEAGKKGGQSKTTSKQSWNSKSGQKS